MLRFDWDEHNRQHIAAHEVAPAEAEQAVSHDPFDLEYQVENGEERFVQLGETQSGRILIVMSTWRNASVRVITAFDAPKAMKTFYIARKE